MINIREFLKRPIAHRGLHSSTCSENSMGAFKKAIESGFPIEIDVNFMNDGKLAVIHDSNLCRLCGTDVNIGDLISNQLKEYPLRIDGQIIPTLDAVLDLVNGEVPLLIELKVVNKFDSRSAEKLLNELSFYPYKNMIALQSFSPCAVRWLKKHTREYAVGQLATMKLKGQSKLGNFLMGTLKILFVTQADFISYDINYLPNKHVLRRKKEGYPVLSWTINSPTKLENARRYTDNYIFEAINPH